MYSVVLMVALTGGAETPAWGMGCKSCSGCCSGYDCCSSYSCGGCCSGWSKGCCHGGGLFSGFGRKGCCSGSSCHGCCSGSSCHGCCSGWSKGCCHGGGLFSGLGCHKSHGCHGCCSGYSCCGGYGCTGSCGGYGCTGGCSGYGCCGGEMVVPAPVPEKMEKGEKVGPPKKVEGDKKKTEAPAPAKIIVSLPADARLTIDGAVTTSVSDRRIFQSPELPLGKTFSYTLKAEYNQDGKPVVVTKNVTIQAGAEVNVTLAAPTSVVVR